MDKQELQMAKKLNAGFRVLDGSARVFAHFGLRPSPWR